MKKILKYVIAPLLICCLAVVMGSPLHIATAKADLPQVSAHAYVVMDANSGQILFGENNSKKIYPASTIKLMTAVVAIENGSMSKKITIKQSVLNKIPRGASKLGLKAGQTYTLEELLNLLLIASAADAAESIAVGTCGSTQNFIKKMNQKAEELGLSNTSFDNTIGLDIGDGYTKMYSTAADIAELARYAMSIKEIRDIVSKKTYTLKNVGQVKSTNKFYSTATYTKERYSIIGTKTGTTNAAGSVLVSTARDTDGHELICAFFGKTNRDSTYKDTRKLLDYAFRCNDKSKFSLSLGFYDTRYRTSAETILDLCTNGLLDMSGTGEFRPADRVKEGYFVDLLNKICNTSLLAVQKNNDITVKDFASIFYQAYPAEISEDELQAVKELIGEDHDYPEQEVLELAALYASGIMPEECDYQENICITKEDMVLIAVRLKEYMNSYMLEEAA